MGQLVAVCMVVCYCCLVFALKLSVSNFIINQVMGQQQLSQWIDNGGQYKIMRAEGISKLPGPALLFRSGEVDAVPIFMEKLCQAQRGYEKASNKLRLSALGLNRIIFYSFFCKIYLFI